MFRFQYRARERTLIERIFYAFVALVVLILGFFFLAAAIVAGALLAAVVLARFWWLRRKLCKAAAREFISTEYHVVEREQLPRTRERDQP